MEEIEISEWGEFELKLKELRGNLSRGHEPLLFRGQSNSGWPLTTTLERAGEEGMLYSDYYRLISSIKPAVETFSTTRWDFPPFSSTIEKSSRDYEEFPASRRAIFIAIWFICDIMDSLRRSSIGRHHRTLPPSSLFGRPSRAWKKDRSMFFANPSQDSRFRATTYLAFVVLDHTFRVIRGIFSNSLTIRFAAVLARRGVFFGTTWCSRRATRL
jgi:hypothetical protein